MEMSMLFWRLLIVVRQPETDFCGAPGGDRVRQHNF